MNPALTLSTTFSFSNHDTKPFVIAPLQPLYVQEVPGRGRGVFTQRLIKAGEAVEVCTVLILTEQEVSRTEQTGLRNYSFDWPEPYSKARAFPLGFGMLYNHSYQPNARYFRNAESKTIIFVALQDIQPEEEIFVNYNGDPECTDPLFPDMLDFEIV
jgi:SET domain-containing protein